MVIQQITRFGRLDFQEKEEKIRNRVESDRDENNE